MFLNALMLFGLLGVAVPIIIHLLNRRQFERVVWAAMRFLRVSVEQNQRRIRIEDLILLILRCLLVAIIAIALARPVVRAASSLLGPPQVTAVILLDNSYSMSQTDGVQSRFDAAKKAAEQVIKAMPNGSSVAVLLVSDEARGLIPQPTFDLTLAASTLEKAVLFDRSTDIHAGIKAAVEILKNRPAVKKEIYLITDGQLVGWRRMDEIRSLLDENRREIRAHLLFVGRNEERNLGIADLRLDSGLTPVNQPLRFEVRVKNYGRAEAVNVNVSIAVDADAPMDQAVINSIPAGEQRSISLFARMRSEGCHTVTARIDADHLPADDLRSIALRAVKDVKVLLIDGDSGREPRESEVFFLRSALRPVPRAEWDNYCIKLTIKTPTELDVMRFEDFDAIIAANVTDFSQTVLQQLTTYLRAGGALWIFPGDNINRAFYNDQLHKRYGILPAAIRDTRGDAKNQDKWFSLSEKAHEHEIVSLWRDPAAGTLTSARFFKICDLVPDQRFGTSTSGDSGADLAAAGPVRIVARFADGAPAIVEHNWGQGRVILFATSADTEWTDLPARAGIYVPLVHRTLGYLLSRQDEHLTIKVGGRFMHTAPMELVNKDAVITKRARPYSQAAADLDELNESRRIELVNGSPLLSFGQTDFAGPYQVKSGDSVLVRFAAVSDAAESSIEALSSEQYRLLDEVAHVVAWSPSLPLGEALEQARLGTELWFPLALAAVILAAIEMLLAHAFSKPK